MSNVLGLKCISCGDESSNDQVQYTCEKCGPLLGTLEVVYDYNSIKKEINQNKLPQNKNFSHWRYLPLLPIDQPEFIQPLLVGWTPLYEAKNLKQKFGLKKLWIKDDGRNPTGSLKDRASAVVIVKALEKKVKVVTAASTGNAASSWSAFTALANLKTIIFVPKNAPQAKFAQLLVYGATIIKVNGNYDQAYDLCCKMAVKNNWYNRSTAINPFLGEGKKTAALEICEQLHWQVPDYVFVPVGDGCVIQGIWKGFKDFYTLKMIDRLPKLIGVQAEGSAPLVKAWENGKKTSEPIQPKTIADSIAVGIPRDQVKALRAIRESDGMFIGVSDDEILAAVPLLAQSQGIFAEPAAAASLAGLKKLVQKGICGSSDSVVVLITGNGLKDIEGAKKSISEKPIDVENNIEDVEEKLALLRSLN
jgi:threonine synthase